MKVKRLIKELSKYDPDKQVFIMKEKSTDDITYADEIHAVQQRTLARDDFEYTEFTAVVLLHKLV